MKPLFYRVCSALACIGFLIATSICVLTLLGEDPSADAPWVWHLTVASLFAWGILFLVPGIVIIRNDLGPDLKLKEPEPTPQSAPVSPEVQRTRRLVHVFSTVVILFAVSNFAWVAWHRTGVPPPSLRERAAAYQTSRLNTLRSYAGFWMVLYGIPMAAFYLLSMESDPRPKVE